MTEFYAIEYSVDNILWSRLDDIQYTEQEADDFINSCPKDSGMSFRKKYLFKKEI